MPGYLAGLLSIPGHQYRHAAAWFSVGHVVVVLIVIAVIVGLLAGPVLAEALLDFLSAGFEKAAPGTFSLGLGILLTGLIAGVQILDIAGACLIGAVLLGVILDNYLPSIRGMNPGPSWRRPAPEAMPAPAAHRARGHTAVWVRARSAGLASWWR